MRLIRNLNQSFALRSSSSSRWISRRTLWQLWTFGIVLTATAVSLQAENLLSLADAEQIAVERDQEIQRLNQLEARYRELALSYRSLPDPQLRTGLMNFPIEGGGFRYEGMTQLSVGVRQMIPPKGQRQALELQNLAFAEQMRWESESRRLLVLRSLRQDWLKMLHANWVVRGLREKEGHFKDLVEVVRSLYSVGAQQQQDVLRAELELSRIKEELLLSEQKLDIAEMAIFGWLDDDSVLIDKLTDPEWQDKPLPKGLHTKIEAHPSIHTLKSKLHAHDQAILAAESSYRPSWGIDVAYGYRDGRGMGGESRSDFVSATVSFSLPLFGSGKQDRQLSASQLLKSSDEFHLEHQMRLFETQLRTALLDWEYQRDRLAEYQHSMLPQAQSQASAAMQGYRSKTEDLLSVIQSFVMQTDIFLAFQKLRYERFETRVTIDYLAGY